MEPIRVLNLFTIMNRGGAETLVMNYYRQIDRTQVQFDFMVHRQARGAYDDEIESLGGRIYRMPPIYPQNLIIYNKLLRDFFRVHGEYAIIHSHMSENGLFVLHRAAKEHIPVRIVHAHNAPSGFDFKSPFRFLLKMLVKQYTTHFFTCSSMAGLWLFGKKYEHRMIPMNNAINSSKFMYDEEERNNTRISLRVQSSFVIGNVSRFNKQKNHQFIIDIFTELIKLEPSATLVLVGDGHLKKNIQDYADQKGITRNVLFLGVRSDVPQLMQAMDLFLFPSFFEGLGVVLIEAQAAGLPCLASDRVPNEARVTELLEFLPLEKPAQSWAQKALQIVKDTRRTDHSKEVAAAGYDIAENAKWLQNFYLAQHREAKERMQ